MGNYLARPPARSTVAISTRGRTQFGFYPAAVTLRWLAPIGGIDLRARPLQRGVAAPDPGAFAEVGWSGR